MIEHYSSSLCEVRKCFFLDTFTNKQKDIKNKIVSATKQYFNILSFEAQMNWQYEALGYL
jgi:hypothetical protein